MARVHRLSARQASVAPFVVRSRLCPVSARSRGERAPSQSDVGTRERARTWAWGWGTSGSDGTQIVGTPKPTEALLGLYQETPRLNAGILRVSDLHTIYFEEYGNPNGIPALVVHGGPGAGCYPKHACAPSSSHILATVMFTAIDIRESDVLVTECIACLVFKLKPVLLASLLP